MSIWVLSWFVHWRCLWTEIKWWKYRSSSKMQKRIFFLVLIFFQLQRKISQVQRTPEFRIRGRIFSSHYFWNKMVSVCQCFLWLKSITCNLEPFDSFYTFTTFFTSLFLKRVAERNCVSSSACRQSLYSLDHPQKLKQQMKSTNGLESHIVCKSVGKQIISGHFHVKKN